MTKLLDLLATMSFHVCSKCGRYWHPSRRFEGLTTLRAPRCRHCGGPIERTGLGIMLIGLVVSLLINLIGLVVISYQADVYSAAVFLLFGCIAVLRWIRHSRARRARQAGDQEVGQESSDGAPSEEPST